MSRLVRLLAVLAAAAMFCGDVTHAQGPETTIRAIRATELPLDIPDVYLSRVEVSGDVAGQLADVAIAIDANVTTDAWTTVELNLPEISLSSSDHETAVEDGMAVPVLDDDRGMGLAWRFRGLGKHTLTLSGKVAVSSAPGGGQQITLSLPERRGNLYEPTLRLRVPADPVEVRAPEAVAIQTERLASDDGDQKPRTEIRASLQSSRLQIAWSEPAESDARQISVAKTDLVITMAPDRQSLSLAGTLALQAVAGSPLTSVAVDLPDGFELGSVTTTDRRPLRTTVADGSDGRRVRVQLPETASDTTSLTWSLRRPLDPDTEETIYFDGLRVVDAMSQTGTVAFVEPVNYALRLDRTALRGARLVDTGSTLQRDTAERRLDFTIESVPLSIPITLLPQQPYLATSQTIRLHFERDRVSLITDVEVSVESGQLTELPIDWPVSAASGWSALAVASARQFSQQEAAILLPSTATGARASAIDGSLSSLGTEQVFVPVAPQTETFHVLLKSSRSIVPGEIVSIPFPRVDAKIVQPPTIEVTSDDAADVEFTGPGRSDLQRQAKPPAAFADDVVGDPVAIQEYVTTSEARMLEAVVTWHPRSVDVASHLRLQRTTAADSSTPPIAITQTLDFDVSYGRLDVARLEVPTSILERVSLAQLVRTTAFAIDGRPVPPEQITAVPPSLIAIDLVPPRRQFAVQIGPYWSGPAEITETTAADEAKTVRIARLTSAVAPVGETTAELVGDRDGTLRLATQPTEEDMPDWVPLPGEAPSTFHALGSPPLSIALADAEPAADVRLAIDAAQVEFRVLPSGDVAATAAYRFPRFETELPIEELSIRLPSDAGSVEASWDEVAMPIAEETAASKRMKQYRLSFPVTTGDGMLTIRYRLPDRFAGFGGAKMETPVFLAETFVDRALVSLSLPPDQHLLMSPHGVTREFEWQRQGLGWRRLPLDRSTAERAEYGFAEPDAGRRYDFSSTGLPTTMTVVVAPRSLLVLFGAAVTLAFSFLLLRIPSKHQLPLVLVAGFAVALFAVRFQEPLQVLLQPALLGILLAVTAVSIDNWNRDESHSPVLTVPNESAFLPLAARGGASGAMETSMVGVRPGEALGDSKATFVQTAAVAESEPKPADNGPWS